MARLLTSGKIHIGKTNGPPSKAKNCIYRGQNHEVCTCPTKSLRSCEVPVPIGLRTSYTPTWKALGRHLEVTWKARGNQTEQRR